MHPRRLFVRLILEAISDHPFEIQDEIEVSLALMEPLPLPSPIHYELLLQLLERQTALATVPNSALRDQVNQLIITLRKAAAQQKQIEETCSLNHLEVDFRWSLNYNNVKQVS